MISAPSLATKAINGVAVTVVCLIPIHCANVYLSLRESNDRQNYDAVSASSPHRPAASEIKAETRSYSVPPISPKLTGVSLHTRYFSTGTAMIYTW